MNQPMLVIPNSESLFSRLRGQSLIVRCFREEEIQGISQAAQGNFHLKAVWLSKDAPLSSARLHESWADVPVAFEVTGVGDIQTVINMCPFLRGHNIRILIPGTSQENFVGLRILSSAGITPVVTLPSQGIDWEALNDLLHYDVYARVPHAPIEPFAYAVDRFRNRQALDLGPVYFDNPEAYLHVDEQGHVATSQKALESGTFLGHIDDGLDKICASEAYYAGLKGWRQHFLQDDGCAYCPGWRLCMGRCSDYLDQPPEQSPCQGFFESLFEAVEFAQNRQQENGPRLWQY